MRKSFLVAVAGILAGLLVLPPVASAAQPRFGLKVGMNLADLSGSDIDIFVSEFGPKNSKVGFCGGAFVVFGLSKGMDIQVEALYTQKGANFKIGVDGAAVDLNWNSDYFEIPVLFKYTFETKGNVKPVLFAGPAVAFKMTAKLKGTYQGVTEEMDIPGFESMDFGLVFGGGLDIGPKIRVDLRYVLGLTKLVDLDGVAANIKNGVFTLMVGYSFK